MPEGLGTVEEKPSNTEVLGLLIDEKKLKFISRLTHENVEGLTEFQYFLERLDHPDKPASDIAKEVINNAIAYKTSVPDKKGNQADKIVDALKHIIEDESHEDVKNLMQQIKS